MHDSILRRNTPWLDMPLVFSGNYREYECTLEEASQCEYQKGYWRFWYEADHRYALPTVAFFLAVIVVFSIPHLASSILPRTVLKTRLLTKLRAFFRYASYRTVRIPLLGWNSAPVGLLILAAVGVVFFFSMTLGPQPYYWPNTDEVDYGSSPPIATRAGWMGLACMPFVFATAGKANLITLCTGVSHERLQVFHRWISYAFFVLALIHTFPFIIYNFQKNMMSDMWDTMVFYWTGVVALIAQAWLTFASLSPLRNWCYEWFKFSHFVAALIFMLFFFFHCDATLTAWDYFAATGVLFALSWLYRQTRIYFEHGLNHRAELSRTSNRFIRIVVPTNSTWAVGQHYFVRFMGLGTHAFTTHPFSACSLPSEGTKDSKYASELVLFIRPRGGFTARLAKYIDSHPNAKMRVLLDGPYGGILPGSITDNQRMLVIAGGSGAGWAFPLIMAFLKHARKLESADDTGAYPALKVVLATRELPTAEWFGKEVQQLLDATPALKVEIYLTGAHTNEEIGTPEQMASPQDDPEKGPGQGRIRVKPVLETDTPEGCLAKGVRHIQHLTSRPDLQTIVAEEARMIGENQSLSVLVCGPASMQHDVSSAVAREQLIVAKRGAGDIYLHLEHFSWA